MIRLAVRVDRADAELVLAELLELAPSGVEERQLSETTVEYAVYGASGELPALPDLQAAAGGSLVEIVTETVADDWDQRWKAFHKPITLDAGGRRMRVRPPWEEANDDASLLDLVIDPGQAFGTGAHATTRLCLELLLGVDPDGGCIDLGCGSGVLAIAAAKLGWAPVAGFDHEAESVEATLGNAAANSVAVSAERFDLRGGGPVPSAELVLANLLRPILLDLCDAGFGGPPPRLLILSGLLTGEADEVATRFVEAHGLTEIERRSSGEWSALLLGPGL
ncbi:MAG: methyltransferase [Actinobacteria bacterium]|uniref:Unannotated protein n=1 Tax=freshwater metagenome TaxID=449393 RepID=A0A6J5ZH81_9ZZZZ|nr:methyltransferase [Actinomycetota bacterium]